MRDFTKVAGTGPIRFLPGEELRELVAQFVRECQKAKHPTKRELSGRSLEEDFRMAVEEIMKSPDDARAIYIIMRNEDTDELPGKVLAWQKVLRGAD